MNKCSIPDKEYKIDVKFVPEACIVGEAKGKVLSIHRH